METCYAVKVHAKKKIKDGDREWSIPSFTYYAGRKHGGMQTTTNHYAATAMTQNLAERVAAKLNVSGMEATVCDLFTDAETMFHETLADIGEKAGPPDQAPGSIAELANAIERCFQDGMNSVEILNLCNKAVIG